MYLSHGLSSAAAVKSGSKTLSDWHSHLGYASKAKLKTLASSQKLGKVILNNFDCLAWQLGKQPALPFNKSNSFSSTTFDLIHYDIWGTSTIPSMGGSCYFVIFIDGFSRYTWIYLMYNKFELVNIYSDCSTMVKTQFSYNIKVFRSDNALEYKQSAMFDIFKWDGTVSHSLCPGTSQQNGRAECKLRHIIDTICTLLISASVSE